MNYRDADLSVHRDRGPPPMVHHDLDAPPWWNYHTKKQLYYDGFVPKGHRALMQFLMVRENGPEKFAQWENDYRDIEAWMDSLRPPKYPFAIDRALAGKGRALFDNHCARCHGTYGADGTVAKYPGRVVPLSILGTDPVRLTALTPAHRSSYAASWFNEFGRQPVDAKPAGYMAPPLSGIWASAPYLHNGSVPTLWHVLHAARRPVVWHRVPEGREQEIDGYDQQKIGVAIETLDKIPAAATSLRQRREYFDTRQHGKSAAGHTFPEQLSEPQKQAVLEYLKTL
jgi:mono/diheme cytochrome c family protein